MKPIQIKYRLIYFIRNRISGYTKLAIPKEAVHCTQIIFQNYIDNYNTFEKNKFTFLNQSKFFNNIDWDFKDLGLLWTFNLNYFDFLHQKDMDKVQAVDIIKDFIAKQGKIQVAFMAYPISLRGMNWIKAFSRYDIQIQEFDKSLFAQYKVLIRNLEYQHLANHLIENGFSLLFGAYYFRNHQFYKKAKKILVKELEEQILIDGAHFELSPMYHQIILFRILDCYNLVKNNSQFNHELESLLLEKAQVMLSWMDQMSFKNGTIPNFNDSANNIAPTSKTLREYAGQLGIQYKVKGLQDSGYRKFLGLNYQMIMDVGNLGGVDYNLAHSHNDMLSYELHVFNVPAIVNTGTSTYGNNSRRIHERQTSAHNTVTIDGKEQNHVWSVHRVARRSKCIILNDEADNIKAYISGAFGVGLKHQRVFVKEDKQVIIKDKIIGSHNNAVSFIHFAPGIEPRLIRSERYHATVEFRNADEWIAQIKIEKLKAVRISDYEYARGYNDLVPSKMLEIDFEDELKTTITF